MARFACLLFLALILGLGGSPRSSWADGKDAEVLPGVPDPELQKAINRAIDHGAAWLEGEQKGNGALGGVVARGTVHHEIGTTALAGLALLAAGRERGDASVDRIYEYVYAKDQLHAQSGGRSTYDTGILLMFVTDYWRGKPEPEPKGRTRPGRRHKNPCNLPPEILQWVQKLANWLVRVRKTATSTWGYPAHRDDHSNTQYAFLGLRAARDCGAKIPAAVFVQAAKTMMERQEQEGPKVIRIVPSPDPNASPYAIDAGDRARGWSYMQEPFLPTGSMTTSGIAILAICHDALTKPERASLYTGKMGRDLLRDVQDGFSWLEKNWTVTRNPGVGAPDWHYYYLYGLERACVFGGRDLVGPHDWYIEGSRHLVSKQHDDGHWASRAFGDGTFEASDVVDTAWAVLFLARATRPMEPLRPPTVTPGG